MPSTSNSPFRTTFFLGLGAILLPALWLLVKYFFAVPDRFLPAPDAVLRALFDIKPPVWLHAWQTLSRVLVGTLTGILAGVSLGIILFRLPFARLLLLPSVQALRAIPPIATVPFFLLWFGFSETGKYLLIVVGIAFNLSIASLQVLSDNPERYTVMFRGFALDHKKMTVAYSLPRLVEELLPTIRFSVATAIGLVVVSELLGAQLGLGYLIQTARSTFSMHAVFLATILLGLISVALDGLVVFIWLRLMYWRKQ